MQSAGEAITFGAIQRFLEDQLGVEERVGPLDHDLTRQRDVEPQGQRIVVQGRVLDGDGRPVPDTLVEVWQANAGGRYRHASDQWASPLDPGFDVVDEVGLRRTMQLTAADVGRLAAMGPSAFHASADDLRRRAAGLPEVVEVTAAVTVTTFRRR